MFLKRAVGALLAKSGVALDSTDDILLSVLLRYGQRRWLMLKLLEVLIRTKILHAVLAMELMLVLGWDCIDRLLLLPRSRSQADCFILRRASKLIISKKAAIWMIAVINGV